jgi:hypothetical protein
LAVDVLQPSSDRALDSFLDLLLDEASSEGLEGLVQKVVFRIANGEFERVNLDDDALNFEDRRFVLVGRNEVDSGLHIFIY